MDWLIVSIVPVLVGCLGLCLNSMYHCLVGLENFNVFLGVSYLYLASFGIGVVFVTLVVILTLEIVVSLVLLTRFLVLLESDVSIGILW